MVVIIQQKQRLCIRLEQSQQSISSGFSALCQPADDLDGSSQFSQTTLIDSVALNEVLPQHLCRPYPKLRAPTRVDPVAYGEDSVQIVVLHLTEHLPSTFLLNCCKKCNGCLAG